MYILVILLASVFTVVTILLFKTKNILDQVLIFGLIAVSIASFYMVLDYKKIKIK